MAILDWRWIGYVRGGEISYLDFLVLAVYFSLPDPPRPPPFRLAMAFYLIATLVSALGAEVPTASFFYSWQLVRMFMLYVTVYRGICADPRVTTAILKGIGIAIIVEAALTVWQRFAMHMLQAIGTFPHQNTLGLISHFAVFPFFAILLGGRRGWLPTAAVVAGLIVEVMTTSRGTIVLGASGLAIVFLMSASRRWTSRKAMLLLAGVGAAAVFIPLAASSLQQRFTSGDMSLDEDTERIAYKKAAEEMLSDHPMGVGANHYTFIANIKGYFDSVGETWGPGRSGNVHNVYWLVAAETGYFGLATFVILLFRPLILAFTTGLRHIGDPRGDLLVGLGVALLMAYSQSFEEWIFVTFDTQYIFANEIGLIAGLASEVSTLRRT